MPFLGVHAALASVSMLASKETVHSSLSRVHVQKGAEPVMHRWLWCKQHLCFTVSTTAAT